MDEQKVLSMLRAFGRRDLTEDHFMTEFTVPDALFPLGRIIFNAKAKARLDVLEFISALAAHATGVWRHNLHFLSEHNDRALDRPGDDSSVIVSPFYSLSGECYIVVTYPDRSHTEFYMTDET